jgi:hypothetical protein
VKVAFVIVVASLSVVVASVVVAVASSVGDVVVAASSVGAMEGASTMMVRVVVEVRPFWSVAT